MTTIQHVQPEAVWDYNAVEQKTTLSVADLLLEIDEGNPAAWKEIMRRYDNLVWATVRSFRLQYADALDAIQMTWLRLIENRHRVRSPDSLAGWLATTASRECLSILRQAKRTVSFTEAAEDVADPSVDPAQHVVDVEMGQVLRNFVAELSPRRQTLMRALFVDNFRSYAEVSRAVGIPPGSIGPTRARTLRQLRRLLNNCGLESRS